MNRTLKILFFIPILSACTAAPDSRIASYELSRHQIRVSEIVTIDEPVPFTAADSLDICQKMLQCEKAKLIEIQKLFIDSLNISIANISEKTASESNPTVKRAYELGIKSMENKKTTAQQIIYDYNNRPRNTSLKAIISKIDFYAARRDSLIGYTLPCTFKGRQGLLPEESFARRYLLSSDKQLVISEIIEP